MSRIARIARWVLAAAAPVPAVRAQEDLPPPPSLDLVRLAPDDERPRIDGILDEPIWRRAARIDGLTQVEPDAGRPASQRTEVLLCYDARSIFLGLRCLDSEPAAIRATQATRDARLDPDDRVEFFFDTFHDKRNAFWFQIGAGGSKGDALMGRNGSDFNKQWDAIWHGRSRVTGEGWFAEVEIPLQSISFDPEATTWGFNVVRHLRRRNESARWASPTPRLFFFNVSAAGTLRGIEGLEHGLGLDVVPFTVADAVEDRADHRSFSRVDAGFDLFWRLTPSWKLSASFNTDFAETEVDERQVNLTRFPLFFPEKRDFFLEDAGAFTFGGGGRFGNTPDVLPFFSRRIGLDEDGREVPLEAAAKITGRSDGWSVGAMGARTGDLHELDERGLLVARVSRDVFESSDAGVIFTRGDPTGRGQADTYGADFNFRRDDFLGDRSIRFNTWVLGTDHAGPGGDGWAYHAGLGYPNDEVEGSVSCTVIERDFDPALGFVQRTDVRKYAGSLFLAPRVNGDLVRQYRFGVEPRLFTDVGGEMETYELEGTLFGLETQSGDELELAASTQFERLLEPFEIVEAISIPAGSYRFARAGAGFETSGGRPVALEAGLSSGGYFDGRSFELESALTLRPSRLWNASLEWSRTDANLAAGSFVATVTRARVDLVFSPDVTWSTIVQHDNQSEDLGLNSRLWWILEPGREAFLVLNHGWVHRRGTFAPADTVLTLKLGWTFRF